MNLMTSFLRSLFVLLFMYSITIHAQNKLAMFDNLIGKTWKAEGKWGDGSTFKQEITFTKHINGQLIHANSNGFIDAEKTKWGERNFGTRQWDEEKQIVVFTENDVFGGSTTGTVESNSNGDIIYHYTYGGTALTDYWEKLNPYEYKFTVGIYENGQFSKKFLETNMIAENHKTEFDFWIGEWVVYNFNTSKIVGYSKIESILNGNAIKESYRNASETYSGTSLNKYNSDKKQWEQFWVDNSGLTLHLSGQFEEGKMILSGFTENGKTKNKITWSQMEGKTVRQVWEQQKEGEEKWTTIFDGHYKKN